MSFISCMSVVFPKTIRDNNWFRQFHGDIVSTAEGRTLSKLWANTDKPATTDDDIFNECMAPYLSDPFRGAVERRVLSDTQDIVDLEIRAVENVLKAKSIDVNQIDLVLCNDMMPNQVGYGNAVYLAKHFNFKCTCMNIESTCSSTLQGMILADSLIASGRYKKILLVMGTANTKQLETSDTLSWFIGDGVVAVLMEQGTGILAHHSVSTHDTLAMFKMYNTFDKQDKPCLRTRAHKDSGTMARTTAGVYLRECVNAVTQNGNLDNIDWFVFHTASAMYPKFSARVLGVSEDKYYNLYHRFANVGSCNFAYNLTQAVLDKKITPGSSKGVLLYSVGSSSTACAIRYTMVREDSIFLPFDFV